jgi:hypothetical protein
MLKMFTCSGDKNKRVEGRIKKFRQVLDVCNTHKLCRVSHFPNFGRLSVQKNPMDFNSVDCQVLFGFGRFG